MRQKGWKMRLIDADAIPWEVAYIGEFPVITKEEIDNMPTAEAIPVEFIESTMNRWKEIIGYEESVEALRILIDNWKIERKEE